jgi:hypothetical protein
MRFILDSDEIITCLPSNLSETFAVLENGVQIKLVNHFVSFNNSKLLKLHPDVIALICTLTFYPFIKNSSNIIFPLDISNYFASHLIKHFNKNTKFNIDPTLIIRKNRSMGSTSPSQGTSPSRGILSWGGGVDSHTILLFQPDIYKVIVHLGEACGDLANPDCSTPNPPDTHPPGTHPPGTHPYLNIISNIQQLSEIIKANFASQKIGWSLWCQVLIPALLVSEDYEGKLSFIGVGGNLGSVFLHNGSHYHPTHINHNLWYQTFSAVGLPLYVPLAGLTDIAITKLLYKCCSKSDCSKSDCSKSDCSKSDCSKSDCSKSDCSKTIISNIKYCGNNTGLDNCHKCPKCLRRELILFNRDIEMPLALIGPSIDYIQHGIKYTWIDSYYLPALDLIENPDLKNRLQLDLKKHSIKYIEKNIEYQIEQYQCKPIN